jgi:hypothetical protein
MRHARVSLSSRVRQFSLCVTRVRNRARSFSFRLRPFSSPVLSYHAKTDSLVRQVDFARFD